ncbi:MAG TPA: hypothetical protein VK517_12225 [Cyclobacteriaceae bacterium]|nr:hypothetical protein [Cyclobacteriaceae bacterium]
MSARSLSQSPEISLREFASSQIKKGVRSLGMGGNGATWGNYALTWRDSGTALINVGVTSYSTKNNFSFTVLGVNGPALKSHWVFYVMALSQYASDITFKVKSPALGTNPSSVTGDGSNQAMFFRGARPLGHGFSVGFLLSYERSQFSVNQENNPANFVRYVTGWLPSGGIGLTWQPNKRWLFGFRGLFNHDHERRIDNLGTYKGLNLAHEYRFGLSFIVWEGALIDIGANLRHRSNQLNHTLRNDLSPNLGFEQSFWNRQLALRFGLDESSPTCGFSVRKLPFVLDVAYINNLGKARLGTLFGSTNNSIMATLTYQYGYKGKPK